VPVLLEVDPTLMLPKLALAGDKLSWPFPVPVPVSETEARLVPEELNACRLPLTVPVAVGSKATLNV